MEMIALICQTVNYEGNIISPSEFFMHRLFLRGQISG